MFLRGKFNNSETRLCFLVWIISVLYAIYKFAQASQSYFQVFSDYYDDFEAGWLGPIKRDKADFEWETVRYFIKVIFPFLLLYTLTWEVIEHWRPSLQAFRPYQKVFTPLLYLTYLMGYKITLLALLQPVLFYLLARRGFKPLIWGCNLICLALIAGFKNLCTSQTFLDYMELDHFKAFLSVLVLCWMNLKCTSFFLSNPPEPDLGYCFYLPTLFVGPFIHSKNFKVSPESFWVKSSKLGMDIARCMFWAVFLDFGLHFIYVNATMFQLELVGQLDFWALCGWGYLMGQYFHIKYVVLYGLSTALAAFEGVTVPRLPRCIGRVHLYSDMWKYFDPGLYDFLKMFIYVPSLEMGLNKLGASFLCFGFVYLWHGTEMYVLIWASLNFLGVTLETALATLYAAKLSGFECLKGGRTKRRLRNVLAAPLLAMSAVSNFYFFAGKEVGDVFVQRIFAEPWWSQFVLLSVLYCCCEVSTELQKVESGKMG